jgi:hypothetical protein
MLLSFQVFATGNYGEVEVNSVTISDILYCLRVVHVIYCVQYSNPTKVPAYSSLFLQHGVEASTSNSSPFRLLNCTQCMTQNEYMMTALSSIENKVQSVQHKCGRSEVHYILNATD